jgi:glycosyltransferase involved in cell wall biosynthesis
MERRISIMHLAIVSPYPPSITGIGQYGYYVSHLLAQSGVFRQITVLTGSSATDATIETSSSPIYVKPAWQPDQWSSGWSIRAQLQRLKPDLAWFNLGASIFGRSPLANLSGFLSPSYARRLGIPTVVTLHELVELADLGSLHAPGGSFAAYGARLLTRIGLQADVVCLTMRRYADWLTTRQPDLHCIHIPIGAYRTPELLPEDNSQQLLFFTTIAPFKGLEVLLAAFRSLQPDYPNLRLTIAGADHPRFPGYAQHLREQFKGLTGVNWAGQIPEEHVRELFRQAQIIALPYNASTGSSSVLYQAAMWGRSVVTSDLAETQAVVCETGLKVTYFERGNPAGLAKALKMQIDSPSIRRQQTHNNFLAIQHHRPEETCRAYLQAFNIALGMRRSPKRISIPTQATPESL